MKFQHYWIDVSPAVLWCSQCGALQFMGAPITQPPRYLVANSKRDPWDSQPSPVLEEPDCQGQRCPNHQPVDLISTNPDGTSNLDPAYRCILPWGHPGEHQQGESKR